MKSTNTKMANKMTKINNLLLLLDLEARFAIVVESWLVAVMALCDGTLDDDGGDADVIVVLSDVECLLS